MVTTFLGPAAAQLLPSVRSRVDEAQIQRPADLPEDAALEASGAIIGQVRHVRLNVFDTTIPAEDTALFRLANRIHIVTRESVLGAQLLFQSGDRYDARLLRESERILRGDAYLRDARISPVTYRDGVVDIEVITQDTWTLKPEVSFGRQGGRNRSSFGIEERNLFGTGAQLGLGYRSDPDRNSKVLLFDDTNVAGSHWHLLGEYALNSDGRAQEARLERPFFSLDARWAAGIDLRNETRIDSVYDNGSIVDRFGTHERVATAYAGWSAGLRYGWVTRWTAGITSDERRATALPDPTASPVLPAERDLVYPWVGIEVVEDEYRETRNQDQIARTEDLELGWHAKLRLGFSTPALGSDRRALVFDGMLSKGLEPDDSQTLLIGATANGRLADGSFDDALFGAAARYYWRQTARRTLFVGLSVDRGVHLDVDRQLTLGGDTGLRGYPFRFRTGQGRWLLTAEQRVFTDWYPFRLFNIGGAMLYDMGRTWGANQVTSAQPPVRGNQGVLRDIGFGLRLGNSRSATGSVVHVDIAYPLDGDPSIRKFQFHVEAKRSF